MDAVTASAGDIVATGPSGSAASASIAASSPADTRRKTPAWLPNITTLPGEAAVDFVMRRPSTNVPFLLPRSSTVHVSDERAIRRCGRESVRSACTMTSASWLRTPASDDRPRPIVTGRSRLTTRVDSERNEPISSTGVAARPPRAALTSRIVVLSSLFVSISAPRESPSNSRASALPDPMTSSIALTSDRRRIPRRPLAAPAIAELPTT
jgi:hypothetical protein